MPSLTARVNGNLFALIMTAVLMCTVSDAPASDARAWIHLSTAPLLEPPEHRLDEYWGDDSVLYATMVVDSVDGDYVAGVDCGYWLESSSASVEVGEFSPRIQWRVETSPGNAMTGWPDLPGELTPAIIGSWTLRLLDGGASQACIGLAPDSALGHKEPVVIVDNGRASPIRSLFGAGINVRAPEPVVVASGDSLASLGWFPGDRMDTAGFPQPGLLRLHLPYPGAFRWGTLAIVVRDQDGVVSDVNYRVPSLENGNDSPRGWLEDPVTWHPRPSGFLGFRHPNTSDPREILLEVQMNVPGASRPLSISMPWAIFEDPFGGRDTLWTNATDATATVSGGVPSVGAVVHSIVPDRFLVSEPRTIELLGEGLGDIQSIVLTGQDSCHSFSLEALPSQDGRLLSVAYQGEQALPGYYTLTMEPEPAGGVTIVQGILLEGDERSRDGGRSYPDWFTDPTSIDAECAVIIADQVSPEFTAAAEAFVEDVLETARIIRFQKLMLTDIRDAVPGAPDSAAIRICLEYGYSQWRTAPIMALLIGDASEHNPPENLLPTAHASQGFESPHFFDGTYAMDAWYGDVYANTADVREIAIGRISVQTSDKLSEYGQKLLHYEITSGGNAVAFVVGDANNSYPDCLQNSHSADRRPAAEAVMAYIAGSVPDITLHALYSHDYDMLDGEPGYWEDWTVAAGRDDVIALVDNNSLSVLEFFGNTCRSRDVTHLLGYDGYFPDFRAAMFAQQPPVFPKYPLVILGHCLSGAFDEYNDIPEGAPIEDLVFAERRGAIAGIGKGQQSVFEADTPLSQYLYEELIEGSAGSCLGLQLNGVLERFLTSRECNVRKCNETAWMTNLIGDPSMALNLPWQPKMLRGSFEARDALPLQCHVVSGRSEWHADNCVSECAGTRIVHGGDQYGYCGASYGAQVFPIEGERMLRVTGQHSDDGNAKAKAWTLFSADRVGPNGYALLDLQSEDALTAVLSYDRDRPTGDSLENPLLVDLTTRQGMTLTDDIATMYGEDTRLYGGDAEYLAGTWHQRSIRLSEWAEEEYSVDSVVVHYSGLAGPEGAFWGWVDDVYIGPWSRGTLEIPENAVLNGDFSVDDNEDGLPDFWTPLDPTDPYAEPAAAIFDEVLIVSDTFSGTPGIAQVLPRVDESYVWRIGLIARGEGATEELCIGLADCNEPDNLQEEVLSLTSGWLAYEVAFPSLGQSTCHQLRIEVRQGSAMIDSVYAVRAEVTGVPTDDGLSLGPRVVSFGPSPTIGSINFTCTGHAPRGWAVELFSIDGRCVGQRHLHDASGKGAYELDLRSFGTHPLESGVYLLRLSAGKARECHRVLVVR